MERQGWPLAATPRPVRKARRLPTRSNIGRPLDPTLDARIRDGVLQVLEESGYGGLTMDAVAQTAGVGKASIYRRWPSKVDLLMSVVEELSVGDLVVPDTGSLRDDLVALLRSLAAVLAGPGGHANRAVLTVLAAEPALAAAYRSGPLRRWAEAFTTTLERGVARGEVAASAGTSLAAEAGPAIVIERWLLRPESIDPTTAAAVVDGVMMPLFRLSGAPCQAGPDSRG